MKTSLSWRAEHRHLANDERARSVELTRAELVDVLDDLDAAESMREAHDRALKVHTKAFAELATKPVTTKDVEHIVGELIALSIGGCTCMTKTGELDAHAPDCRYRVTSEAALIVSKLAIDAARYRIVRDCAFYEAEADMFNVLPGNPHEREDIKRKFEDEVDRAAIASQVEARAGVLE